MAKKPMTEAERLELCKKLDKDLDDFIESLPKKKSDEAGPEDNWQDELTKHPFFMKQAPEAGDEMHPLYEGLQQLKYDPLENTAEDLAISYKDDGNFNFKHKNYRLAILAYTEGLKSKCENTETLATLFNNRSASNYFLKNYRSCLLDCEEALKLNPNYEKALIRAINCCIETERFDKGLEYCDRILTQSSDRKDVLDLRSKLLKAKKRKERNIRRAEAFERKQLEEEAVIKEEIKKRNIRVDKNNGFGNSDENVPELARNRIFLDEDNRLVWPVVLLYPEFKTVDLIQQFCEDSIFSDQLSEVFKTHLDWDTEKKYTAENTNVYYEDKRIRKVFEVDVMKSLADILSTQSYVLQGGCPSFLIFAKNCPAELKFLIDYKS